MALAKKTRRVKMVVEEEKVEEEIEEVPFFAKFRKHCDPMSKKPKERYNLVN